MASLESLLSEVGRCRICAADLPLGPRPVLQCSRSAKILIAGQAPGRRVHASGVAFDDASGERLRDWMGIDRDLFYDASRIAILPLGFCYPGSGKSGDLPPRPECAPQWREALLAQMPHPSPRNNRWLGKNPWFAAEILPQLQARISQILDGQVK